MRQNYYVSLSAGNIQIWNNDKNVQDVKIKSIEDHRRLRSYPIDEHSQVDNHCVYLDNTFNTVMSKNKPNRVFPRYYNVTIEYWDCSPRDIYFDTYTTLVQFDLVNELTFQRISLDIYQTSTFFTYEQSTKEQEDQNFYEKYLPTITIRCGTKKYDSNLFVDLMNLISTKDEDFLYNFRSHGIPRFTSFTLSNEEFLNFRDLMNLKELTDGTA